MDRARTNRNDGGFTDLLKRPHCDRIATHAQKTDARLVVIAVAADRHALLELIKQQLSEFEIRATTSVPDFIRMAACADCRIIAVSTPESKWYEDMCRWRSLHRNVSIVYVTAFTHADVAAAVLLQPTQLIWLKDVTPDLRQTVSHFCSVSSRAQLMSRIRGDPRIPKIAKDVVTLVLQDRSDLGTVGDLATFLGRDRRTIWRQWSVKAQAINLSLKELIDWGVLLRAYAVRQDARNWREVSESMKISQRTLSRMSRRLTERSLNQLGNEPSGQIVQLFESRLIPEV